MSETQSKRKRRLRLLWLPAAGGMLLIALPVVLLGGVGSTLCTPVSTPGLGAGDGGNWLATAYGPPWNAENGDGITATGFNLTAGQPAYEIAVDPSTIPLGSFERIQPNPFGTDHAFYAGDTGGAIAGRHVDIYDWQGRDAQNAWGERRVRVTSAPAPGTGNLLGEITPPGSAAAAGGSPRSPTSSGVGCEGDSGAPLMLTPGQTAKILSNGTAAAPADAPRQVKLAIAAGNELFDKPYLYGGGHGQPLTQIAAAYDCSSSTSFLLHAAGVFADWPETSGQLESYGVAGTGDWITVYANSGHAFVDVDGIVMDTAWYSPVRPTSPGSGPRWQPASIISPQYSGDRYGGFVQRHPRGL